MRKSILFFLLCCIAGTSWADTKTLYFMGATWNDYCIGSHAGTMFKSPQQAQRTCGFKDYDLVGPAANGDYGLAKNGTTWFPIYAKTQSCELKNIPGEGTNGTHSLSLKSDKAPNMVRRCINNCEVEDRRVKKEGAAAGSDYGGVVCAEDPVTGEKYGCSADYTRIQTGAVCIPKPEGKDDTQYDDVTANPGDDNGNNGADGTGKNDSGGNGSQGGQEKPPKQDGHDDSKNNGSGNGGNNGGNQNGGQGGDGKDSPRDSGSADDPVEDKDKDKDKPGKGKGGHGGGGGKHGDKDKNDKDKNDKDKNDKDKEDKDKDDGKGGDGKGGEGKGDGKDGKDGKGGKDKEDGSPNGKDDGTGAGGDKDGKGSGVSGGNCETGEAPKCKGDPVQCYIAKEQWRTACLAEKGGTSLSGGSCRDNRPPECKGDEAQCYIVKQQFYQGCQAVRAQEQQQELENYGRGKERELAQTLAEHGDPAAEMDKNSQTISVARDLDTDGFGWTRSCPVLPTLNLGVFGEKEWRADIFCSLANILGHLAVLVTLVLSARYILD